MELGTVYTENPLHGGQSVVPNSHVDAGDSDTLLASMQATVEEQVRRVDKHEERAEQIESLVIRFEALERQVHQQSEQQSDNI